MSPSLFLNELHTSKPETSRSYPFNVRGQGRKCSKANTELTRPPLSDPSSHSGAEGGQRVRRVMKTYLLALMPSLRVAKPSATRDSAMFSPLVSEKEKRELNTRFKSASNGNRARTEPPFTLSSSRRVWCQRIGQSSNVQKLKCWVFQKTSLPKMSRL